MVATLFFYFFYGPLKFLFPATFFVKDLLTITLFVLTLVLARGATPKLRISLTRLDKAVLLYCGFLAVSAIASIDSVKALEGTLYAVHLEYLPVLLYWIVRFAARKAALRRLIQYLLYTFLLISCGWVVIEVIGTRLHWISRKELLIATSAPLAILDYKMGMGFFRPIGIIGTSHASGYLASSFTAGASFAPVSDDRQKWSRLRWTLVLFGALATFLSFIRMAYLSLGAALLLGKFGDAIKNPKAHAVRLARGAILATLTITFLLYFRKVFLLDTFTGSLADYIPLFMDNIRPVLLSPIFGLGLQLPSELWNPNLPGNMYLLNRFDSDIHWIALVNTLGLVGASVFFYISVLSPMSYLIQRGNEKKALAAIALTVGLSSLHYSPYVVPAVAAVFWISLALLKNEDVEQS